MKQITLVRITMKDNVWYVSNEQLSYLKESFYENLQKTYI